MEKQSVSWLTSLKGMAMGIAEVIPGVSGGTIAFITGIYERLINCIKAFGPELFVALRQGGLRAGWQAVDGAFLAWLLGGMAVGVVSGVFGVSHLLENYPPVIWAFFFGLIVASVIYIGRQVGRWGVIEIIGLLAGTALAYWITVASPAQGPDTWWFIFLSGIIAISALILPGISGSFILLLMGMYTVIIPAVKGLLETREGQYLSTVVFFALGCLVGLATFSRVLSWTFRNYRSLTLATLTGFMLGSLNKIWPWRNVLEYRTNSKGLQVPFLEENVLPADYTGEPFVLLAVVMALVGFASVFLIERFAVEETP
ncbi:MAG: DUF368 domain-containing protein [Saprospiraceae bacterium]|nr:DUF368 domain-containing protein [Saprospiraceae bacterium]